MQPYRQAASARLINEAIKRILLDIVIRGHGDRLIGRWSREPDIQQFLDQVPYMLDRINQLHLACTRVGSLEPDHLHHHHRHEQSQHHQDSSCLPLERSSLSDFMKLIGNDMHWLVRSRDALGLSPLHKAVLFGNIPIAEFIVDRYPDELAACSLNNAFERKQATKAGHSNLVRLIDARDKYGRTALHYAAAIVDTTTGHHRRNHGAMRPGTHRHHHAKGLYHFLAAKGAAQDVQDFRGKTPVYYLDNPWQLHCKSVIHIANRMNASYQANILSKLVVACNGMSVAIGGPDSCEDTQISQIIDQVTRPAEESVTASCSDLRLVSNTHLRNGRPPYERSLSNLDQLHDNAAIGQPRDVSNTRQSAVESANKRQELSGQRAAPASNLDGEFVCKQVRLSRISNQIIDQKTRQQLRKHFVEGNVEKIGQLVVDGYGDYIMKEASVCCWNTYCKRYVTQVIPKLLESLDRLHEKIARNELDSVQEMLYQDPVLARIKRPYRRASMSALHLAIHLNRVHIAKMIIERFPELIAQQDSHGATCLHWAARSLRHDSLYYWLIENFGHQLEQMRDFRGRSASEYQHQAIRLFSLAGGQQPATHRDRAIDASDILESNQRKCDQIYLNGTKLKLYPRNSSGQNQHIPQPSDNFKSETTDEGRNLVAWDASSLANTATTDMLDRSIEIAIDTPTTYKSDENDTRSDSPLRPTLPGLVPFRRHSFQYMQLVLNDDSCSPDTTRALRRSSDTHLASVVVRSKGVNKFSWLTAKADGLQDRPTGAKRPSNGNPEMLLNEMVQLDSSDLCMQKQCKPVETYVNKKTKTSAPVSHIQHPISRPESASGPKRLEEIMVDCIQNEDYNKLEHLVLAGCGQKILDLYARRPSLANSSEMIDFIENHTPAYIETIDRTHEILHQTYSNCEPDDTTNLKPEFHKLCNLLSGNGLIMSRDSFGASPMHVAIMRADARLISFLMRRQPEVVSAPDLQGRNALHYAAMALNAYRGHGSVKLVRPKKPSSAGKESQVSSGHWLVDLKAQKIYDRLCDKHPELVSVEDKKGVTCSQYLGGTEIDHVDISKMSSDSCGLMPAIALEPCCSAYSQILSRYNYMIAISLASTPSVQEVNEKRQTSVKKSSDGDAGGTSKSQDSKTRATNSSSCFELSDRGGNYQQGETSKSVSPRSLARMRSLFRSLDNELPVPEQYNQTTTITQMAPKPTVGCSSGFPPISSSPTITKGLPDSKNQSSPSELTRRHGQQKSDPTQTNKRPNGGRKSPINLDRNAHKSIIGGVIVPTVVHDDQSGEVQSYDIIYRQPTPTALQYTATAGSQRLDGPSPSAKSGANSSSVGGLKAKKKPDDELSSCGQSANNCNSDSDDVDDGEDDNDRDDGDGSDERVERLSSEFESRVTREKDELRAKVDHIMTSIKACSSKTGRLFYTNNNNNNNNNNGTTNMHAIVLEKPRGTGNSGGSKLSKAFGSLVTSPSSSGNSSSFHSSSSVSSNSVSRKIAAPPTKPPSTASSYSSSSGWSSPISGTNQANGSVPSIELAAKKMSNLTIEVPQMKTSDIMDRQPATNCEMSPNIANKNAFGQTYLHFVASRPQAGSSLYKVLEHAQHLIGERDAFYRTARDVALQFNQPENVLLIDEFVIDSFIGAKTSLLRHLLNQGYSPLIHVADSDGNDIMLILKLLKLDKMIHFLLQMADFQRWRDELHTFIRHGYSAGVSELIRKNKDLVRARSIYARTSIHLVVLFDRTDLVDELLALDPDCVCVTDNMGRTPLHYSFGLYQNNSVEIRAKLIASGADLEQRDVKMRIPKYYTILRAEIEDIRRLELELN